MCMAVSSSSSVRTVSSIMFPILFVTEVVIVPMGAMSMVAMSTWAVSRGVIVPMGIIDHDRCGSARSCHGVRPMNRPTHVSRYK